MMDVALWLGQMILNYVVALVVVGVAMGIVASAALFVVSVFYDLPWKR